MIDASVTFAVYGALNGGDPNRSQAINVQAALQAAIGTSNGIVNINNETMGIDPSPNNQKYFAAIVTLDSGDCYFAGREGQTINFFAGAPAQ